MYYRRITDNDRINIWLMLQQGLNQQQIALRLGFNKSSISREIKNNGFKNGGYWWIQANLVAWRRQAHRRRAKKMTPELISKITNLLYLRWSPEQISNRLKKEGQINVCAETIYKFVYRDRRLKGILYQCLRRSHVKRRRRFPGRRGQKITQERLPSIELRPEIAQDRKRVGDWERDTMQGGGRKEQMLVIVDRKTRYSKIGRLKSKTASQTNDMTIRLLKKVKVKTITNDRGTEFFNHQELQNKLNTKIYFCHPQCPSERGTNENLIGLLRQYFPKGDTLSKYSNSFIKKVEKELNFRPRKNLNWLTPYECFYKTKVALCS